MNKQKYSLVFDGVSGVTLKPWGCNTNDDIDKLLHLVTVWKMVLFFKNVHNVWSIITVSRKAFGHLYMVIDIYIFSFHRQTCYVLVFYMYIMQFMVWMNTDLCLLSLVFAYEVIFGIGIGPVGIQCPVSHSFITCLGRV